MSEPNILPQDILDYLAKQLDYIDDPTLQLFREKGFAGGPREGRLIRKMLAGQIRANNWQDKGVTLLFKIGLPYRGLVEAVSSYTLHHLAGPLMVLMGKAAFVTALLYDERPEVQDLAAKQLSRREPDPATADMLAATHQVWDYIRKKIYKPMGWSFGTDEENDAKRRQEKQEMRGECAKATKAAEAKEEEVRQKNEVIRKLEQSRKDDKAKATAELQALKAAQAKELGAVKAQADELAQSNQQLQAVIAGLKADMIVAVEKGIQDRMASETGKWLKGPLETEQLLVTITTQPNDPLIQGETVLKVQAEADRLYGNRVALAKRLADLVAMHTRVREAEQNAIHPAKQLGEVRLGCEVEIARIQKALGQQRSSEAWLEALGARINGCRDWDGLRNYSDLVERLTDEQLVSQHDAIELHDRIHAGFSRLQASDPNRLDTMGDNGWSLRGVLHRNEKARLILDGHNLLYLLKEIFEQHYESDHPGKIARNRLEDIIRKLVESRPNVCVTICYDSPIENVEELTQNIELVFSGGQGADRADQRIEDYLLKPGQDSDCKTFVVTDDRPLRGRALRLGALYVPVGVLAVLLNDFKCL